jgi:adenine-specific DNA-methyltransferase
MRQKQRIENQPVVSASKSPVENLFAARIMARALAECTPDEDRIALARAFCFRLVSAWWSALDHNGQVLRPLLQPEALATLPDPAAASADAIGSAAAQCEPEAAAYAIGLTYTGMLPATFRADLGVFYTPPVLTSRLLDQATAAGVDWAVCRALDPACGGGAFLAPVAQRMLAALQNVTPGIVVKNIAARLRGYEIDPFAAWLSQVTLDAVMLPVRRA